MIDLIPSVPEILTVVTRLLYPKSPEPDRIIAWSLWRRTHQKNAAIAHYKRQNLINTQL
jgi:hypothetical protein